MKYLKLFEGFSTDEYYVELTPAEHDDLCKGEWIDNTFGNDCGRLLKILVDNDLDPSVYNGKWVKWDGKNSKIESIRSSNLTAMGCVGRARRRVWLCYPLPDDYYLVERQDEYYEMKFYKCDQIEGVIKLLKDLDVI